MRDRCCGTPIPRTSGQFMAPVSLRPEEEAPRSTKIWVGSSGSEAIPTGGSIPEGTSTVAAPGMGSLSVTGPTGRGGAKPETRLRSVASEYLRPPTSEVKSGIHSMSGGEVLSSESRSRPVSGSRVVRRSAILQLVRTPFPSPIGHSYLSKYRPTVCSSIQRAFCTIK